MKVRYTFSDIPSGYIWYTIVLGYIDKSVYEYCVVKWDPDGDDAEIIDSSWYCTKREPSTHHEIDYVSGGDVIYQDYTSYYSTIDFAIDPICLSMPFIYAYEY